MEVWRVGVHSETSVSTSRCKVFGTLVVLGFVLSGTAHGAEDSYWLSDRQIYKLVYTSALEPPEINRIHEWLLHIETVNGEVVENAEVTVDGGMPLHNHGLPTRPRVTEYLGNGNYRVEGVRFHMHGQWEISITIKADDIADSVTIALQL